MKLAFHNRLTGGGFLLLVLISLSRFPLTALGQQVLTATFDDLQESVGYNSVSDGGITFSDLDLRLGFSYPGVFAIDEATASLPSPFSPPNALTFGGGSPGPGGVFGRFGSAWIDFNGPGASASVDAFYQDGGTGTSQNILTLEAWHGANLVASSSAGFDSTSDVQYRHLSLVSVPFDRLRLVASGPEINGVLFLMLDNVSVITVPEPAAMPLATLGLVVGLCFYRRNAATASCEGGR